MIARCWHSGVVDSSYHRMIGRWHGVEDSSTVLVHRYLYYYYHIKTRTGRTGAGGLLGVGGSGGIVAQTFIPPSL